MIGQLIKELEQRCPGCIFKVRSGAEALKRGHLHISPAVIIIEYGRKFIVDLDRLGETAEEWLRTEIEKHPLDEALPLQPNDKYRVICVNCGPVVLGYGRYIDQLRDPNACWFCPNCGGHAKFDMETYENYEEQEHASNTITSQIPM